MVKRVQVVLTDDLDGTPATHTHHLTLDGRCVRLDLNDTHSADLLEQVGGWIEAGTAVRSRVRPDTPARRSTTGLSPQDRKAVRWWARANGHQVGDRGRIATHIIDAWREAGEPRP